MSGDQNAETPRVSRIWGVRCLETYRVLAPAVRTSSIHGMSHADAVTFAAAHPGTHELLTRLDYGTPWVPAGLGAGNEQ